MDTIKQSTGNPPGKDDGQPLEAPRYESLPEPYNEAEYNGLNQHVSVW